MASPSKNAKHASLHDTTQGLMVALATVATPLFNSDKVLDILDDPGPVAVKIKLSGGVAAMRTIIL